ncbi:MAG: glycerophosphodiester phosphodiesterase [Ferribacterium limneticum]
MRKPPFSLIALVVAGALSLSATAPAIAHDHQQDFEESAPLVIGHRGTAGYLPDHTLEGYALAIELGADYIEPDLVSTKDGVLIARHEPNITATTDVADRPEFAVRRRTMLVDGALESGFFASDFTLAEIKTLRAKQPIPADRPTQFDGKFQIPTFDEVIALAKLKSAETGRVIGIYPETKHPTYHQKLGLPLEDKLLAALTRAGWNHRHAPVFIQSFEQANLKALSKKTKVRLVQLVDADDVNADGSLAYNAPFDRPYDWTASGKPELLARNFGWFATDEGLDDIATYAYGIGPWKRYIVSTINDGSVSGPGEAARVLAEPTDLIERAHSRGIKVHTWTFRNEQRRLANDYAGNPINEYLQFYRLGIDGVFSDFTDTAIVARTLFKLEKDGYNRCFTGAGLNRAEQRHCAARD